MKKDKRNQKEGKGKDGKHGGKKDKERETIRKMCKLLAGAFYAGLFVQREGSRDISKKKTKVRPSDQRRNGINCSHFCWTFGVASGQHRSVSGIGNPTCK